MKAYKLEYKDLIMVLRFLTQFGKMCDSNEVSKGMAFWEMQTSMKGGPASNLAVRMAPRGHVLGEYCLPKVGDERSTTYIEYVDYLHKSYATDSNNAKATLEMAALRKVANEICVQFSVILRTKVVQCRFYYPKERTIGIFIDGLPTNMQSLDRMFRGREQDTHLLEIAMITDTLLEQAL